MKFTWTTWPFNALLCEILRGAYQAQLNGDLQGFITSVKNLIFLLPPNYVEDGAKLLDEAEEKIERELAAKRGELYTEYEVSETEEVVKWEVYEEVFMKVVQLLHEANLLVGEWAPHVVKSQPIRGRNISAR